MAFSTNPYSALPAVTIAQLKAAFVQCLLDIATTGQNYVINGRTYGAADTAEVSRQVGLLQDAEDFQAGRLRTVGFPVFRR